MKRNAFTMIELIFVIVILGILASVAIPKLAGVQDDALESTERAAIASARTGVQALHGKRVIRGAASIRVSLTNSKGKSGSVTFDTNATDTSTATAFSEQGYPWALSVSEDQETDPATLAVTAAATQSPLLVVLEIDNPAQWSTTADANYTRINGPASTGIDIASDATITSAADWRYDAGNGQILLDANGTSLQ